MAIPTILHEDEALLVTLKPAGIHSVALTEGEAAPSIGAQLLEAFPFLREVADRPGDAGLINRLDFGTSGILIGAKTRAAWEILRGDIQNGRIKKRYLAVVEGISPKETAIENYIGSPYRRSQKVRVWACASRKIHLSPPRIERGAQRLPC
jgi:23S rRNA-/tRNA-specific pseudouridylate synthase